MIVKYCTKCKKVMAYNGHSMCDECRKEYEKSQSREYNRFRRNRRSDNFYHSKEWKDLSRLVLARANYRCADCGGLAVEVHHEVEISECWEKRFDISNLTPLCTSCHNKRRRNNGAKQRAD